MTEIEKLETKPDCKVEIVNYNKMTKKAQECAVKAAAKIREIMAMKPATIHPRFYYPFWVRVDLCGNDNLSACIIEVNYYHPNGNIPYDYFATISGTGCLNGTSKEWQYELDECFYPNSGAKFSTNEGYETQINIFGYFKTLSGAFRNLKRYGNSTYNDRKPKEIYV